MSSSFNVSARGGRNGRGRGGRGFAGGRGFTGRGKGSGWMTEDKTPWERMGKVTFDTNLLHLKKACSEYASENHVRVQTCFDKQMYVIDDRPTKEKIVARLNAAARGDLSEMMGFDNVVFRSTFERMNDFENENDLQENENDLQENEEPTAAHEEEDETEEPEAAVRGQQHGYPPKIIAKLYQEEVVDWNDNIRKLKEDKRDMYKKLWNKCDELVKSSCRASESFHRIENSEDVLLLYILLNVVLSTGGHMDPTDRKIKIEEDWRKLTKGLKEPLESFKERFDLEVKKLQVVGINLPEVELASHFMRKLDVSFDRLVQTWKRTGTHTGAQYYGQRFATVEEAFAGAQGELTASRMHQDVAKWHTPQQSGNRFGASFTGQAEREDSRKSGRGGRGRGGREIGGRGRGGRGRGDAKEPIICDYCNGKGHKKCDCTSSDWSTITCYNCEGIGHFSNNCPSEPKKEKGECEKT